MHRPSACGVISRRWPAIFTRSSPASGLNLGGPIVREGPMISRIERGHEELPAAASSVAMAPRGRQCRSRAIPVAAQPLMAWPSELGSVSSTSTDGPHAERHAMRAGVRMDRLGMSFGGAGCGLFEVALLIGLFWAALAHPDRIGGLAQSRLATLLGAAMVVPSSSWPTTRWAAFGGWAPGRTPGRRPARWRPRRCWACWRRPSGGLDHAPAGARGGPLRIPRPARRDVVA